MQLLQEIFYSTQFLIPIDLRILVAQMSFAICPGSLVTCAFLEYSRSEDRREDTPLLPGCPEYYPDVQP